MKFFKELLNYFEKPSVKDKKIVFDYLMRDFFSVIRANEGVDIPYFMRPKSLKYEYQAVKLINWAIKNGKFGDLYKKALAAF